MILLISNCNRRYTGTKRYIHFWITWNMYNTHIKLSMKKQWKHFIIQANKGSATVILQKADCIQKNASTDLYICIKKDLTLNWLNKWRTLYSCIQYTRHVETNLFQLCIISLLAFQKFTKLKNWPIWYVWETIWAGRYIYKLYKLCYKHKGAAIIF